MASRRADGSKWINFLTAVKSQENVSKAITKEIEDEFNS